MMPGHTQNKPHSALRNLTMYQPVSVLTKIKYKEKLQFSQKILEAQFVQSIVFFYLCMDER